VRAESSISATLYRDKVQVKHSYKLNELIRHKLELDELKVFLISSFRLVLYVVCFLLGNYPASGFYMQTFRNTLSVPSS